MKFLSSLLRVVLTVAGFGFLVAAAWVIHLGFGLAAAGVSLLVLDWLRGGKSAGDLGMELASIHPLDDRAIPGRSFVRSKLRRAGVEER